MKYGDDFVESFRVQGFVSGIRVRDRQGADAVRECWDALEAAEDLPANGYSTTHSRHLDQRFVWDLACDPKILDPVEALIGENILLFGTRFFCKYGDSGRHRVSWHQDLDSWALTPPVAVTVWYAVDDSTEQNGCMQVIPGSHRAELRRHDTTADNGNILGRGQHLHLTEEEKASAVPVVLNAGEISIHDGALLHASMPNLSNRRRCGLAIRYVPAHVRQHADLAKSPPSKAILVRGCDRVKNFGVNHAPVFS
ncbi:phytanoyl-CoA dioxygenase family protein [Microbispora cellulosiformans]|uniref:Phytanoyl-CoA dioxygenase family protein n=1 Tax=Microbispora cellulosiformans TaxID=2614688 RepID=A0A5J5KBQ8_9ACTN|nr:phytanoyl-CoA dioxygenase family protein [Microbispora cellulosiformans]KAA9381409.1 phytanoyl-CoA dioxygenase family protein [Microbispora cellulosiformans]